MKVFIFTGDMPISDKHQQELANIVSRFDFAEMHIFNVDAMLERYRTQLENPDSPWSIMMWARCFIADLLPQDICGNVVYLDIDTLVCRDLHELFSLDMGSTVIAGVYEDAREDGNCPAFWGSGLICDSAKYYFNSGVLVLNLDLFRKEKLLERIVDWYSKNKGLAERPDQDALNALFWDRMIPLHPAYNHNDGWLERSIKYRASNVQWRGNTPRQVLEAIIDPAVLHFWGRSKPWKWNHRPEGRRYESAMRELGLLSGSLPGTTMGRRMIRMAFAIYHAFLKRVVICRLNHAE